MTSRYATTADCRPNFAGRTIPTDWFSRDAEYPWCYRFVRTGDVAVDAGCGPGYPFKDALADVCKHVYAVDMDARIRKDPAPNNLQFVVSSIRSMAEVSTSCADRVFCISVLEHTNENERVDILRELSRVLKPDGLIILTQDIYKKMIDACIGMYLGQVQEAGLSFAGDVDTKVPENALYTDKYGGGIYVFMSVLRKR
jgi:ubiquinone/menaquinone biosynthesis C-methylase UbiE